MAFVRQARTDPDDRLRAIVLWLFVVGDVRHHHADHRSSLVVAAGSHVDVFHLRHLHRRGGGDPPQPSPLSDGNLPGVPRHPPARPPDPYSPPASSPPRPPHP